MSQPESLISLGTNLLWCDSSLYYRPWPHNTEVPVHGFLPFVIVVFVCPLKVMVCQAWYLLLRSLQQQIHSPFWTSSLSWHVKQRILMFFWYLVCPDDVAVNGCFEITVRGKNLGGERQLQTETVQELHWGFLCSWTALLGFELIQYKYAENCNDLNTSVISAYKTSWSCTSLTELDSVISK